MCNKHKETEYKIILVFILNLLTLFVFYFRMLALRTPEKRMYQQLNSRISADSVGILDPLLENYAE